MRRGGPRWIGRRRWTGGIEGGGGGGENATRGHGREGQGKKRDGRQPAPFLWRPGGAAAGKGRGVRLCVAWRVGTGKGEGARVRRGTARATRQRPTTDRPWRARAARRGHIARSIEQGRDPEADRWAAATVPGGGTG
jgi:hypothetical protein